MLVENRYRRWHWKHIAEGRKKRLAADDGRQSRCGGDWWCTQNWRGEFEWNPKGSTHIKYQTTNKLNKTKQEKKKTTSGQRLGRRGTEEARHKRGKRAEEKGVKYCTKVREHQANCLT
jgi:hypothetical protein